MLGPALAHLERMSALAALPPDAAGELRAALSQLRRDAAALDLERDRVLAHLRRENVVPLVLKGAALRGTLYADPAERPGGDIDLLVEPREFGTALLALERSGYMLPPRAEIDAYRRHHFHVRAAHPLGYVLELHWGLTEPGRAFRLDAPTFLREAVTAAPSARAAMRVPRWEHMLLHLVFQNVAEGFRWLSRLVDVDRITAAASPLDWDGLLAEAERARLTTALALTLELAARLLGTEVPAAVAARLRPSAAARLHLALLHPAARMLAPREEPPAVADWLIELWLIPDRRARASAFSRLVAGGFEPPLARELGGGARQSVARRALALTKLSTYQAWLYVVRAAGRVPPAGRALAPLWSSPRPTPAEPSLTA